MKIVIDLQGAQSNSRSRGIGRYSLCFAQSLARNRGDHEVIIVLNEAFPETIDPIRRVFQDILPKENIKVWGAPGPVSGMRRLNKNRRKCAEIVYGAFLANLSPDIVHISSLFEGYGDESVVSIGSIDYNFITSVTLYDFIPLHNPGQHLDLNPIWKEFYYEKLENLKKASLLLAISEFTAQDARTRINSEISHVSNVSSACSEIFSRKKVTDDDKSRFFSGIGVSKPIVLISGTIEPHKNLERFFCAFASLPPHIRDKYVVVLMGNGCDQQKAVLYGMAHKNGLEKDSLVITGYISDENLILLYNCCELMVFPSMDEGFGLPVLEAMACGAPVIASRAASIPEILGRDDVMFDPLDTSNMTDLIYKGLVDVSFREMLKNNAIEQSQKFSWDKTAKKALQEMEAVYQSREKIGKTKFDPIAECVKESVNHLTTDQEILKFANNLASNFPKKRETKTIFVDVSELQKRDVKTGCQRVVRGVLFEWLRNPPDGYLIEPVYSQVNYFGYHYARGFLSKLTDCPVVGPDDPIEYCDGDIFFGLDLCPQVVIAQELFLSKMKWRGVAVYFLVHDTLPVTMPDYFLAGTESTFKSWFNVISKFNGLICVSQTTAESVENWYNKNNIKRDSNFLIECSHNGFDISNSIPTYGIPSVASDVFKKLNNKINFIIVSTLEPRKGHMQVLSAFELLWKNGIDVNLVIVGKAGWGTQPLVEYLKTHIQNGEKLFWLNSISDEYLEKLYELSDCLLATSLGEGFGLPLVEAAHRELPILARDIPIYREVAGEYAAYFSGLSPEDLYEAIKNWLAMYREDRHPASMQMPRVTWEESARHTANLLVDHCAFLC